jgi:hypothetical protein
MSRHDPWWPYNSQADADAAEAYWAPIIKELGSHTTGIDHGGSSADVIHLTWWNEYCYTMKQQSSAHGGKL